MDCTSVLLLLNRGIRYEYLASATQCSHDLEKRPGEWRPEKQFLLVGGVICEPREGFASWLLSCILRPPPPPRLASEQIVVHPP